MRCLVLLAGVLVCVRALVVQPTTDPFVLDGVANEPFWASSAARTFSVPAAVSGAAVDVTVKAAYSLTQIYVTASWADATRDNVNAEDT